MNKDVRFPAVAGAGVDFVDGANNEATFPYRQLGLQPFADFSLADAIHPTRLFDNANFVISDWN